MAEEMAKFLLKPAIIQQNFPMGSYLEDSWGRGYFGKFSSLESTLAISE